MSRYSGGKKSIFKGCGYCGNESDLFTGATETHFVCGSCVRRATEQIQAVPR